jgi:hypothetical protein
MTAVLVLLSALMLLIISRSGWSNTNQCLINTFLVIFSSDAFFRDLPKLYEQKLNIDENKKLYRAYTDLDNRMRSFVANFNESKNNSSAEDIKTFIIKTFIIKIDDNLAGLHILPLNLDPEAVSTPQQAVQSLQKNN